MMIRNEYLQGKKVFGDDLSLAEIEAWYKDEENGCYNIYQHEGGESKSSYDNKIHSYYGYKNLEGMHFDEVLGIGSGDGREFIPIVNQIGNLTILEVAEGFYKDSIAGCPVKYVKPEITGTIKFEDNTFDLIIISSALHHIPNVTYVLQEVTGVSI